MRIGLRLEWLLLTWTLLGTKSAFAYLCICSPDSCTVMHPNSIFFDKADSVCSNDMLKAKEITIIKLLDANLSRVAFEKFPSMTVLEIIQGNLTELNEDTFGRAGKLSKLLIQESKLTTLKNHSFQGADNLKDLTISENPLESVAENAFSNLQHLENLALTNGKIKSLPKNLFENNRKLKKILLNSNQLSAIDSGMFNDLNKLTKLELADNRLKAFDLELLRAKLVVLNNNQLENLVINMYCRSMYANNNRISTIEIRGEHLRKLSVIDNKLDNIRNITSVESLTSLSLSGNKLNPKSTFSNLTSLEELDLRSTYIDVTEYTFADLTRLRILDLSYNNLTEVDFKMFTDQASLQTLAFVGNKIGSLDYHEAKRYLPQLRVLEICKNGWNSSYLESNMKSMKNLGISGFGSDYTNKCTEKLSDDYEYDDNAEQMEEDIGPISPRTSFPKTPKEILTTTEQIEFEVTSSAKCKSWFSTPFQCWYAWCQIETVFSRIFC